MLTEAEKKWLYSRENVEMVTGTYLCQFCQYMDDELEECIFRRCPKFEPDYRDAAEFEARVAAQLATMICDRFCADILNNKVCCRGHDDRSGMYACRLKRARLAVEEEMEK